MRKIVTGIIQQSNTPDLRTNLKNLAASIAECAYEGAQLIVLQELHNSLYFARPKIRIYLTWPNPYLVRRQASIPSWQRTQSRSCYLTF
jgi:predicted amidohydrolase